jgi:hypothetical protein
MHIPELNNAYCAMRKMLAETVSAKKVDTAQRDALHTAAQALDREISRRLVVAGIPEVMEQYAAGLITLNELGQHFLLAYTYEGKK